MMAEKEAHRSVCIVVVSHSPALARAAVELASQLVPQPPLRVAVAAGLDDGTLGTARITNSGNGAAATFTVNNASANSYSGEITGNLGLRKTGAGSLLLNGVLSQTGVNSLEAGVTTINTVGATRTLNEVHGSTGDLVKAGANNLSVKSLRVANVTVTDGHIVVRDRVGTPKNANNHPIVLDTLTFGNAGSALNVGDNDLIVNNMPFNTVHNMVITGFGSTTDGLISSSNGSQILALFDNALVGLSNWQSIPIGANAIVGKYTYFGDANMDGQVTGDDYTIIDSNLNTTPAAGVAWLRGDMNIDGTVTGDDYTVIDSNLGLGVSDPLTASSLGGGLTPSSLGSIAAVPEPGSIGFLVAAGAGMLLRRRRTK
jgi:hypothetical protein